MEQHLGPSATGVQIDMRRRMTRRPPSGITWLAFYPDRVNSIEERPAYTSLPKE